MASRDTLDAQLADELAKYYDDPLGHVMFSYPWDADPSIQMVELQEPYRSRFGCKYGPDVWACEFLDDLGAEIRERNFDGRTAVMPIRFSTTSGHGIGKSTIVAWLIKFIMDTRPFAKGVVTAGTEPQLKTKTWAEVGKWHKLSQTQHWFDYSSARGNLSLTHKQHKETWRCDAQTCKEENSESFAGLHAANSTPFYIFDEASQIPDSIYEVRDGGTTDGEPMVFDFGNPTRNSGRFFEQCVGNLRHRYKVRCIDSRDVAITNKALYQEWIDDRGVESDYVKVRVRGIFPTQGSIQFIDTGDVNNAMMRDVVLDRTAPLLIGVDVARFGNDDTVIYPRIGNDARSFPPVILGGYDSVQVTGKVIEEVRRFRDLGMVCAGLFIDGGNIGGAIVDNLRNLGYNPIEVQFGGGATDKNTYRYKSDEMWGNMREGIRSRLALPTRKHPGGERLYTELTQREYGYTKLGNKVHLESKDEMKERGISSPDLADALALTYAHVVAAALPLALATPQVVLSEYDPLEPAF